ncbi:MAG: hypothetical protein A2Z34_02635 [Planctomycetes bacterium RBG_16_59_8]|nr:MAG: hypothetical protein A2Z34_02635 [Planctomycetes bacterium RBG_16_59_8]
MFRTISLAALIVALLLPPLSAQEDENGADEAKKIQQEIQKHFSEVAKTIDKLAKQLKETEPENAAKLESAWNAIQEKFIDQQMKEVVEDLNAGRYNTARNKADKIRNELDDVLKILIHGSKNERTTGDLAALKREIGERIREQEQLQKELNDAMNKVTPTLDKLEQQIRKAELDQEKLAKETSRIPDAAMEKRLRELSDDLKKAAANEQDQNLPQKTEQLAKKAEEMFEKLHESGEKLAHDFRAPKQDIENAKADLQKENTPESRQAAAEDMKQAAKKIDEMLREADKEKKELPQQAKEQESLKKELEKIDKALEELAKQPANKETAPKIDEARKELQSARQEMQKAQQQMPTNPPQANQAQQKAQEDLQQAQEALQQAREQALEKLPPQQKKALEELKKKQEELAKKTEQTAAKIPSEQSKENAQKASDAMKQAAKDIPQEPEAAKEEQAKAIEELKKALQDIEDKETELALDTMEAKLAWMIEEQKAVFEATIKLDKRKKDMGQLLRSEKFEVKDAVAKEGKLTERAGQLQSTAGEIGAQTFVFFLGVISSDTKTVSDMLEKEELGEQTQRIESDVVSLLEALLSSVKKAKEEMKKEELAKKEEKKPEEEGKKPEDQEKKPGDKPKEEIITAEAEIQLLIELQKQIRHRTEEIAVKNANKPELEQVYHEMAKNLARRQGELGDRIQDVISRVGQE